MKPGTEPLSSLRRRIIGPWFALTSREQQAVSLILFLFLLGLAVKFWRGRHGL